jgi:hypothetical protein
MDPLLQFAIGGVWAVMIALGWLWLVGGFAKPKPPATPPAE